MQDSIERNKGMTDHELLSAIHRRLDKQDTMLFEIRDRMNEHIIRAEEMKPALEELAALWKGSKMLIPILVSAATIVWGIVVWGADHIRIGK